MTGGDPDRSGPGRGAGEGIGGGAAELPSGEAYGIAPGGHSLPAATRLGPVRLRVADVARSGEFYRRILGLVRRDREEGRASFAAPGGEEPLVELVERPGASPAVPRGRPGLYHFALRLPDRPALGRLATHLRRSGVRVGTADHRVSEALYLSDPDGLGVEVYRDRPRSEWRASDGQLVMTTEPLDVEGLISAAGSGEFDGAPAGTDVGHVHLHVADLEEAAVFYHEALGLARVVWSYPGALFLSAGGYHHHVGLNTWAADGPPAGEDDAGLVSWTLVVPAESDIEAVAGNVRAAGYPVTRRESGCVTEDAWGTAVEVAVGSVP